MIEFLSGKIRHCLPTGVILDVNGVGYGVELTIPDMCEISTMSEASLWIHTRVREDQLKLYGFFNWDDKQTFEILIAVNGIGPKIAIAILSTLTPFELKRAINDKRTEILELVPGIGKRSAEKIIVEMTGKIDRLSSSGQSRLNHSLRAQELFVEDTVDSSLVQDVVGALVNLGYKEKDVSKVVDNTRKQLPNSDLPALLKASLQALRKSPSLEI
jgi:Holliday junction DNA helicase RuvA